MINEAFKNRNVLILAAVSALLLVFNFSSCFNAMHAKAGRDKELASRLALEEKTAKFVQEKSVLEEKVKAQASEVAELKVALEAARKALLQDQLVSASLKEELTKVVKLKENLEDQLRQAQANVKKAKK